MTPILRGYLERGRGHSKTTDLAVMVLYALYACPRKIMGYGAASDKDQAGLLRNQIDTILRLNPWLHERIQVNKWEVVNIKTGSRLEIIANDAASSYGHTPDFLVIDELTHWKKQDMWDAMISSAAKRKTCMVVIISNAGLGQNISWQWHARETCRTMPNWYFSRIEGPQASWITAGQLEEQQALLPYQAYLRLWLNCWTSGEGDALDPEDVAAAFAGADGPMLDVDYYNRTREIGLGNWRFVGGLDLGVNYDHSALVILGVQYGKPRIRLAYCKSWKPLPGKPIQLAEVQAEVERVHAKFHLDKLVYDRHQAIQMTQALTRQGLYCEEMKFSGGENLTMMASQLLQTFRTRTIDLYPQPDLERHIRQLTIVPTEWGFKLESARTADGHADTAIALTIALPSAVQMTHHQARRSHGIEAKRIKKAEHRSTSMPVFKDIKCLFGRSRN